MKEEEIINEVIKIKNHQIGVFDPKENIQVIRNYFNEKQRNAIQGLLDLYEKEKRKNKELENADLTTVYISGFFDGEKKCKDKIKEKIEELSDEKIDYKLIEFAQETLLELLEEE